jgi:CBS domain-containing protein
MTVNEIMSDPVVTCSPETTLAAAAQSMRAADYGTLPVIDAKGRLVGIITDRDICLAFANTGRNAHHVAVYEVMTPRVVSALEQDSIHSALATMKKAHVRRLPVLDKYGHLKGLLSLEDVVVRGLESGGIGTDEIVMTLRTMYERRPVALNTDTV